MKVVNLKIGNITVVSKVFRNSFTIESAGFAGCHIRTLKEWSHILRVSEEELMKRIILRMPLYETKVMAKKFGVTIETIQKRIRKGHRVDQEYKPTKEELAKYGALGVEKLKERYKFSYQGVEYDSIKDCCIKNGISKPTARRRINNNLPLQCRTTYQTKKSTLRQLASIGFVI